LSKGKITQEDVDEIVHSKEEEDRELATLTHSIMCDKIHISVEEMIANLPGCSFYAEEKSDEPWSLPAHRLWMRVAELARSLFDNPEDIKHACMAVHFISDMRIKSFVASASRLIEEN